MYVLIFFAIPLFLTSACEVKIRVLKLIAYYKSEDKKTIDLLCNDVIRKYSAMIPHVNSEWTFDPQRTVRGIKKYITVKYVYSEIMVVLITLTRTLRSATSLCRVSCITTEVTITNYYFISSTSK